MGRTKKEKWNPFCGRPKLWQVYGKLVGSELTTLNANRVLGKLPDMTSWAFSILVVHRSEIVSHKFSKVDARLSKCWLW